MMPNNSNAIKSKEMIGIPFLLKYLFIVKLLYKFKYFLELCPEFQDGDIIVINPFLKQEHNDYVVVCNEESESTFKQLKKYGKVRVLHLNP